MFQKAVGEKTGTAIKLTLNFVGSKAALLDFTKNMDDATKSSMSIVSFVNDQGNTYYGLYQQGKNNSKESKK
jgi:hypothetical protein